MYNLILWSKVRADIRKYIDAYELYYENLYTDSGLWIAEEIIINQYRQSASAITERIYDAIEEALTPDIIFGYSSEKDGIRSITTRIENRRLFLFYSESETERRVVDIKIVYL